MPILVPAADMDPVPRVGFTFEAAEIDPSAVTATVLQISAAGSLDVRDNIDVSALGGLTGTDYEVPPGVPVSYQLRQYDSAGVDIGLSGSASTQVDIPGGKAVVQDLLAPRVAAMVTAERKFASALSSSRSIRTYQAGQDTIALMGELSLLQSIPLDLRTRTAEEGAALLEVLRAGMVLIRTMPPMPVPRALYVAIAAVPQVPLNARFNGALVSWPIVGEEVSRPMMPTIDPVFTYGYWKAAFAGKTYAEVKALYTTYLDAKRNPPPEA